MIMITILGHSNDIHCFPFTARLPHLLSSLFSRVMAVINTSVFSEQYRRTILPWTIVQLKEESHTFSEFFLEAIAPRLSTRESKLLSAYVGPEKTSLDPVDTSLAVLPVVNSFGRFLRYYVEIDEGSVLSCETTSGLVSPSPSASGSFVSLVNVRNKKDKLYNDIATFFISRRALFIDDEAVSYGKELVTTLRDVLWYLDGYHAILAERAIPIPSLFQPFRNYNIPELSKHRRRRTANISSDQLNNYVQDLCTILNRSYWDRPQWNELKSPVTQLCLAHLHQKSIVLHISRNHLKRIRFLSMQASNM